MDRGRVSLRAYLGLQPTDDPTRWQVELTPAVLTPAGAMHGGAALAAAVEALEGTTGRPLVPTVFARSCFKNVSEPCGSCHLGE